MPIPILAATIFCTGFFAILIASIAIAMIRLRRRAAPVIDDYPPVSLIRPLCGVDNYAAETLRSTFELDYPQYEILFCVADAADPVVGLIKDLIAAYPAVNARLLIGDERVSANPKLNNVVKGWRAASHDWVVIADSNVLMPLDYVQRLFASWHADTGLVASPPIGSRPHGFWAEIECAFLNTYQARWQYIVDSFGRGFAQGKTMVWRRADLERAGGIEALGREVAEDAAATKIVRDAGLNVRLVDRPLAQPLGRHSAREVWNRQLRWARLRKFFHVFPARNSIGRRAADHLRGDRGARPGLAGLTVHRGVRADLVRQRNGASSSERLAPIGAASSLWIDPRSDVAGTFCRRTARQRFRLAWQRDAGRAHSADPDGCAVAAPPAGDRRDEPKTPARLARARRPLNPACPFPARRDRRSLGSSPYRRGSQPRSTPVRPPASPLPKPVLAQNREP